MTDITLGVSASADSPIPPDIRALRRMEVGVCAFSFGLVLLSIVLFLMEATCKRVSTMIAEQNAAAIKLGMNLDYYEILANKSPQLPPGLHAPKRGNHRNSPSALDSHPRFVTFRAGFDKRVAGFGW